MKRAYKWRKLTDEQIAYILENKENLTYEELASKFEVSAATIGRWRSAYNKDKLKCGRRRISDDKVAKIIEADRDKDVQDLSDEIGVSVTSINRYREIHGLKRLGHRIIRDDDLGSVKSTKVNKPSKANIKGSELVEYKGVGISERDINKIKSNLSDITVEGMAIRYRVSTETMSKELHKSMGGLIVRTEGRL